MTLDSNSRTYTLNSNLYSNEGFYSLKLKAIATLDSNIFDDSLYWHLNVIYNAIACSIIPTITNQSYMIDGPPLEISLTSFSNQCGDTTTSILAEYLIDGNVQGSQPSFI